jgi:hypothetical protein
MIVRLWVEVNCVRWKFTTNSCDQFMLIKVDFSRFYNCNLCVYRVVKYQQERKIKIEFVTIECHKCLRQKWPIMQSIIVSC